MNRKSLGAIAALLMAFSIAQADAVWTAPTSWDGKAINQPSQVPDNQKGLHSDPRWQMLGNQWGVNDGIGVLVDGQKIDLTNGVADINVGDEVTFEFNVHKTLWGVHTFDALKVWLDDEVILADKWVFGETLDALRIDKNHNTYSVYSDYTNAYQYSYEKVTKTKVKTGKKDYFGMDIYEWVYDTTTITEYVYDANKVPKEGDYSSYKIQNVKKGESLYYANVDSTFSVTYTFDNAGEYELLARVVCSSDLAGGHPGFNSETYNPNVFEKNKQYTQGETEGIRIRVTNVPEPSMLILLGLSMFGVAFMRQKRK
ncbi:MAG: PEP-CTERM sorting domain-containing protein [Bacteroidales bacterium]|nr:PEP-CTERM sorting domain-containing protein [Bacteroidales bacterium]